MAAQGTSQSIELTERKEKILSWLSKGCANKESADKLSISLSTVRTHLRHVYEKLPVRSRTEAVRKFLKYTLARIVLPKFTPDGPSFWPVEFFPLQVNMSAKLCLQSMTYDDL